MRAVLVFTLVLSGFFAGCADNGGSSLSHAPDREDAQTFTLPPMRSIEWKLAMAEGAQLEYAWSADRPIYFDFHGDRDDGTDDFVSHKESTLASDQGRFTAPFEGRHGWYWQNKNAQTVTLTLTTEGQYVVVGRTGGNAP